MYLYFEEAERGNYFKISYIFMYTVYTVIFVIVFFSVWVRQPMENEVEVIDVPDDDPNSWSFLTMPEVPVPCGSSPYSRREIEAVWRRRTFLTGLT